MHQKTLTISTQYPRSVKFDTVFQINAWCCIYLMSAVHSSRILGIFPIEARSHFNFHEAVIKSLLSAGHQVTLIAPFQPQNFHENLTLVNSQVIQNTQREPLNSIADPTLSWFATAMIFLDHMEHYCNQIFSLYNTNVRLGAFTNVAYCFHTWIMGCYILNSHCQRFSLVAVVWL